MTDGDGPLASKNACMHIHTQISAYTHKNAYIHMYVHLKVHRGFMARTQISYRKKSESSGKREHKLSLHPKSFAMTVE